MYCLNADNYEAIGAPKQIVSWVREGVDLPFKSIPPACTHQNRVKSYTHAKFVDSELQRLLSIGAIEKVSNKPHCVLALSVVPKKNRKLRLVTDCRPINIHIDTPSFTQEGIPAVSELIQEGDILLTIDIKDGFHHIKVKEGFRQYIGFLWREQFYQWRTLCFGVSIAPYYFNKIVRPLIAYLRSKDIRIAPFVDDFLLMIRQLLVASQRLLVLETMARLGWTPNLEKCDFSETTHKVFVGFLISSTSDNGPWIKVLPQKIRKLRRCIVQTLHSHSLTARKLANIAGQCVSMVRAILPGKLLLRNIYRVISSKSTWDSEVQLTHAATKDLQWWLGALKGWNGAPLCAKAIDLQIETDASSTGWGAAMFNLEASGQWTQDVQHMHINFKELLAVLQAIKSFRHYIKGKHVQILSDNITTVAYINHMGGNTPHLSDLMSTLWSTASSMDVTLSARHLAGNLNLVADRLSRNRSPYEWSLHRTLFKTIDRMWGPHTIDRFAASHNHQLADYNSLHWDPGTRGVDALAQPDWKDENNYVNPPFWMLNKVISVVLEQRAHATIIAPHWPAQRWYSKLLKITYTQPLYLPNNRKVFYDQFGAVPEPCKNRRWRIAAWRVCGDPDCPHKVGQIFQ